MSPVLLLLITNHSTNFGGDGVLFLRCKLSSTEEAGMKGKSVVLKKSGQRSQFIHARASEDMPFSQVAYALGIVTSSNVVPLICNSFLKKF